MNDRLIRAARGEEVDQTPVWFMRQAGRALPRYRELRADVGMFEILRDPEATAEITALPLEYFAVDGCVLYSDLVTPFFGAGFDVELRSGVGPVVLNPVEGPADVERLKPFDPRVELSYTFDAIRLLVSRLEVPVLGFVGAPYTLCSYLIKGPRSRHLEAVKVFMWQYPEAWHRLAGYWADLQAEYAIAQHEAGAAVVQVFDSWAGSLGPGDYDRYVFPHTRRLLRRLAEAGVPTINFATGNPALLPLLSAAGGDVLGVDWRLPIDEAWELVGLDRGIQGNLDPVAVVAGEAVALEQTRDIMQRVGGRPGHIFNLGHGILPSSDPAVLRAVVETVHEYAAQER
ncbi:MAG: uroporphyrinogen decarboxylase [Gemmatimonadota bacterium]|jgi:uroporphyrinogen decarboxylase